jgi:hypothetical protein
MKARAEIEKMRLGSVPAPGAAERAPAFRTLRGERIRTNETFLCTEFSARTRVMVPGAGALPPSF